MTTTKRRLAGRIAKLEGNRWENLLFAYAAEIKATLIKIPEGARTIRLGNRLLLKRTKSPFDFILAKNKEVVFFDAKSINAKTFSKSLVNFNQVHALLDVERQGCRAGYLIHFRKRGAIAFISASVLSKMSKGTSVSIEDGLSIGSFDNFSLEPLFESK